MFHARRLSPRPVVACLQTMFALENYSVDDDVLRNRPYEPDQNRWFLKPLNFPLVPTLKVIQDLNESKKKVIRFIRFCLPNAKLCDRVISLDFVYRNRK